MRNDIHSPANFNPADYEYVGTFDQWPEPGAFKGDGKSHLINTIFGEANAFTVSHAEYLAGKKLLHESGVNIHYEQSGGCDHCGARIRYVCIFRHKPSGKYLAVGSTCASERFGCSSRHEFDVKRLAKRAADERDRDRCFALAAAFMQQHCPELQEWMLTSSCKDVGGIFADMSDKVRKYGSMSEKQINFARKLLAEHLQKERDGGMTDQQKQWEEEKAKAEDCPEGRVKLVGQVIKTEWRESDQYGGQLKMVFKDDRGFCVWSSVPSAIQLVNDPAQRQRGLMRGDRLEFVASLTRSDRDKKFGFAKRPSKVKVLELCTV